MWSWPNQSLWRYFRYDGDGEWIRRGLIFGTIELVHDGSYMQKVDPKICSAAFVIRCTKTNKQASGTLVERSDFADNYRAEALGALAGLLVLREVTTHTFKYKGGVGHCNNKGIVGHCNAPTKDPHKNRASQT